MISRRMMTTILCETFSEKRFLEREKMASRKIPGTSSARIFFMFILLISNHTVFLVQLGMNFALVSIFEKAEIVFA